MKALLIPGACTYNMYQQRCLKEAGVDVQSYKDWGIHLPHHTEEILSLKPDIIHLQWPESLTRHNEIDTDEILGAYRECLPRLKSQGAKLFYVMHNLLPHSRSKLDLWEPLFQLFAEHCDVAHHHSVCGQALATETYDYGEAAHQVIYHGYFDQASTCTLSQKDARRKTGLPQDANIYIAIGSLRPDKYIKEMIECFHQRDPEKDILYLAGGYYTNYGKEMVELAESVENIIVQDGYIEDEEVSLYACSSDAFLYMYGENHLTSGSPHMSQAHLLPQITLDYPYAREVLGEGAIYIPGNDQRYINLQQTLDNLDKEELQVQRQFILDHRQPWHWSEIAQKTKAAYEQALAT